MNNYVYLAVAIMEKHLYRMAEARFSALFYHNGPEVQTVSSSYDLKTETAIFQAIYSEKITGPNPDSFEHTMLNFYKVKNFYSFDNTKTNLGTNPTSFFVQVVKSQVDRSLLVSGVCGVFMGPDTNGVRFYSAVTEFPGLVILTYAADFVNVPIVMGSISWYTTVLGRVLCTIIN